LALFKEHSNHVSVHASGYPSYAAPVAESATRMRRLVSKYGPYAALFVFVIVAAATR
jgi:hypothetical protein